MIYMATIMTIHRGETMKKYYFNNIREWGEEWKNYYLKYGINLSVTSYEEFINDLDDNFFVECQKEIYSDFIYNDMHFYVFLIVYQNNLSDKVFNYYKVWNRVKDDIPLIQKGVEKKYSFLRKNIYVSIASFELFNIKEILEYILKSCWNSFIYCSKNGRLINEQESLKMYNRIFNMNNNLLDERSLIKSICRNILKNEAIIQLSSDGEKIGMDILKKI